MKLYRINEYDWWGGPDLETTLAAYVDGTGQTASEVTDPDEPPREVTEEEMDRLTVRDEDGDDETRTFREQWEICVGDGSDERPFAFATTEC